MEPTWMGKHCWSVRLLECVLVLVVGSVPTAWGQSWQQLAWINQPQVPTGYCGRPRAAVRVGFTGFLRVTVPTPAPGTPRPTRYAISYRFVRSDGGQGAVRTIFFTQTGSPQTFSVSDWWTLWPPPHGWWPPQVRWEAIRILGTPGGSSGTASFRLSCPPTTGSWYHVAPTRANAPPGAYRSGLAAVAPARGGATPTLQAIMPAGFCQRPHYPVVVNFEGSIPAPPHPGTLSYRFVRSDGASGPIQMVRFLGTGTQPVRYSWTLWTAYKGWVQLDLLSPMRVHSARADFDLGCGPLRGFYPARR